MNIEDALQILRKEWRDDPRLREAIEVVGGRAGKPLLEEAKASFLSSIREQSTDCPCCGRSMGAYCRGLSWPIAEVLIWVVQNYEKEPRSIRFSEEIPIELQIAAQRHTTFAKYWGFLEQEKPGYWRPTQACIDWVHGRSKVPVQAFVLEDELLSIRGPLVGPQDTRHYDYKGNLKKVRKSG